MSPDQSKKLSTDFQLTTLGVLRALGARTPIYVFLSLLEGQGLTLAAGDAFFDMGERYALDRKMLALSEVTFLNFRRRCREDAPADIRHALERFRLRGFSQL